MTEDEAKTKWCPFTRAGSGTFPFNRTEGYSSPETLCIGSACMAWRWFDAHDEAALAGASGSGALGPDWKPTHGFCGLAGAPQ